MNNEALTLHFTQFTYTCTRTMNHNEIILVWMSEGCVFLGSCVGLMIKIKKYSAVEIKKYSSIKYINK